MIPVSLLVMSAMVKKTKLYLMGYEVHIDAYDGPFELLLQLINAQEVDLYELSLATIVDGYLAELEKMEHLNLDIATEFLLIAATLVELKCRRLLPGQDDLDLDEEMALFEARDYLLARLLECRMFSGAADALALLELRAAEYYPRSYGPDERFEGCTPDPLARVSPLDIRRAAKKGFAVKVVDEQISTFHIIEDEISVAETIDMVMSRLQVERQISFAELVAASRSKTFVVTCFLGVLELYKQGIVDLAQLTTFGSIEITLLRDAVDTDIFSEMANEFDLQ
jgi:segregation and condensation protein A